MVDRVASRLWLAKLAVDALYTLIFLKSCTAGRSFFLSLSLFCGADFKLYFLFFAFVLTCF